MAVDSQDRCALCSCCSNCQATCTCGAAGESEDNAIMRLLGIDPSSEVIKAAERFRQRFVREEEEEMKDSDEVDQDNEEEDDEGVSDDDAIVGVISI